MNSNAKEEMNPIKEKYKATIIIPAYNAETTIHRAVDSAVNQTTKEPYEILLMDDGSTDSTSHILDDYAKLHKTSVPSTRKPVYYQNKRECCRCCSWHLYLLD